MFQSTHPHGVRLHQFFVDSLVLLVSIHAPTRGATVPVVCNRTSSGVSIHAPTRGATVGRLRQSFGLKLFQSTHPHGVRPREFKRDFNEVMFQSTHPHGVRRRSHRLLITLDLRFNPRTHTGCDSVQSYIL